MGRRDRRAGRRLRAPPRSPRPWSPPRAARASWWSRRASCTGARRRPPAGSSGSRPRSRRLRAGTPTAPEEAFQYIRALTDANVPDARIWAFVRRGREMVAWLEAHSAGEDARASVRGLSPGDARRQARLALARGAAAARQRARRRILRRCARPHPAVQFLGRVSWTLEETGALLFRMPGWGLTALTIFGNYFLDLPQRLHSAARPAPDPRQRAARRG